METPSSPIDSTNSLPTSPAIFSPSFMDTGRWLRAAGGTAGATTAVEVERAALELKHGAGCAAEGDRRRGWGRRRLAALKPKRLWRGWGDGRQAVALGTAGGWDRATTLGAARREGGGRRGRAVGPGRGWRSGAGGGR
jgi:hypothetical protein